VAVLGITISALFGTTIGLIFGYIGGIVDMIIMRIVDIMMSMPVLFLALALAVVIPAGDLYAKSRHPYTRALLAAVPIPDPDIQAAEEILGGEVPSPLNPPAGCRFHPRCSHARKICAESEPDLAEISPGHKAACHLDASHSY
jgi:oligopeptide/dipeptide ABC transporter ATP-binding protein